MSKINNFPIGKSKEEIKQNEPDTLYNLDVQLLTSIKSIPGKIIPLPVKINQNSNNNNKENNQDMNRKDTFNIINKNDSINNFNCLCSNDKMNIINNSNNNIFTANNYLANNGFNNTSMNFNAYNNNYQRNYSGLIQNSSPPADNQLLFSPSNHPSLISFKSDNRNNNFLWSDIKITQNSFNPNIFLYNNENNNNNIKEVVNKNNLINHNIRLSQLSYQYQNFGNDELYKRKKSTSLLLKQNSDNNIDNIINKTINNIEKKKSEKLTKEKIININEEEKIEENNISPIKDKKIFFNIENYYDDEEDDTIYHNINSNNDVNNLFNCYLKKKKRRKKINEVYKYKCSHPKCEFSYKTQKQLQNHHFKMTQECQHDSVQIIKLIQSTKSILKKVIKHNNKKKEKFEKLYDTFVNKISLKSYFEFIAGSHFSDGK